MSNANLMKIRNNSIVLFAIAIASLVGVLAFKKDEPVSSILFAIFLAYFREMESL